MADFAGNEVSAIAPYRDGVVVAANDLAETPSTTGKTAAQLEAAEKPTASKGQAAKAPDVGSKPGADKDPVRGRRSRPQGRRRRARARCSTSAATAGSISCTR